jgi:hypothetical protein
MMVSYLDTRNMLLNKYLVQSILAGVVAATFPLIAHSEIYKHVDDQGKVTYSNVPMKGGVKLNLESPNSMPSTRVKSSSTPSPVGFPRIGNDTQKQRDGTRRKILEDELANEEKLLASSQKGNTKEEIDLHTRNVGALKKELANLK